MWYQVSSANNSILIGSTKRTYYMVEKMYQALSVNCYTPCNITGISPARIWFGREICIPWLLEIIRDIKLNEVLKDTLLSKKAKVKLVSRSSLDLCVGQYVLIQYSKMLLSTIMATVKQICPMWWSAYLETMSIAMYLQNQSFDVPIMDHPVDIFNFIHAILVLTRW